MFPIIHVHGSLGKLPWQSKDGIPYGALQENKNGQLTFDFKAAENASEQITVISEDQATSREFYAAYQIIANAEQVYFLGFSYHITNMRRLNLRNLPKINQTSGEENKLKYSRLKGDAYKMEDAEINSVKKSWYVQIFDNISDSRLFLRKYAQLD